MSQCLFLLLLLLLKYLLDEFPVNPFCLLMNLLINYLRAIMIFCNNCYISLNLDSNYMYVSFVMTKCHIYILRVSIAYQNVCSILFNQHVQILEHVRVWIIFRADFSEEEPISLSDVEVEHHMPHTHTHTHPHQEEV